MQAHTQKICLPLKAKLGDLGQQLLLIFKVVVIRKQIRDKVHHVPTNTKNHGGTAPCGNQFGQLTRLIRDSIKAGVRI